MTTSERRTRLTAEIAGRTGIDEVMFVRLVHTFYDRVREDKLLEPIFDQRIANWDSHLERICAFWSSVALMSGLPLPVDSRHFDRWFRLFRETAVETCPSEAAAHFIERAAPSRKAWNSVLPEGTAFCS